MESIIMDFIVLNMIADNGKLMRKAFFFVSSIQRFMPIFEKINSVSISRELFSISISLNVCFGIFISFASNIRTRWKMDSFLFVLFVLSTHSILDFNSRQSNVSLRQVKPISDWLKYCLSGNESHFSNFFLLSLRVYWVPRNSFCYAMIVFLILFCKNNLLQNYYWRLLNSNGRKKNSKNHLVRSEGK